MQQNPAMLYVEGRVSLPLTPIPHPLVVYVLLLSAAAAAKSLQSCPILCDPRDGSPPGSPIPGILQARTLEWVAISFSNAWMWKVKVKSLSRVWLFFFFLTLQYCIGFAIYQNESATGIHVFPILNPPTSSLPIPSLWVVPVHQPQASSIVHRTWTGDSFHIWYYTCFNAILPNHPTLSLSHRVQKTVLYISVSFAVSYTGLSLPSF